MSLTFMTIITIASYQDMFDWINHCMHDTNIIARYISSEMLTYLNKPARSRSKKLYYVTGESLKRKRLKKRNKRWTLHMKLNLESLSINLLDEFEGYLLLCHVCCSSYCGFFLFLWCLIFVSYLYHLLSLWCTYHLLVLYILMLLLTYNLHQLSCISKVANVWC